MDRAATGDCGSASPALDNVPESGRRQRHPTVGSLFEKDVGKRIVSRKRAGGHPDENTHAVWALREIRRHVKSFPAT
jgi:hypothetical protein